MISFSLLVTIMIGIGIMVTKIKMNIVRKLNNPRVGMTFLEEHGIDEELERIQTLQLVTFGIGLGLVLGKLILYYVM